MAYFNYTITHRLLHFARNDGQTPNHNALFTIDHSPFTTAMAYFCKKEKVTI